LKEEHGGIALIAVGYVSTLLEAQGLHKVVLHPTGPDVFWRVQLATDVEEYRQEVGYVSTLLEAQGLHTLTAMAKASDRLLAAWQGHLPIVKVGLASAMEARVGDYDAIAGTDLARLPVEATY
jgi:hypothetical protein